jgi:hypothetical protein
VGGGCWALIAGRWALALVDKITSNKMLGAGRRAWLCKYRINTRRRDAETPQPTFGPRQGAGKRKKIGDPRGGWVGQTCQSTKKDQGQIYFFNIFYRVFELPSSRNAQKRDKKEFEKKSVLDFWSNFL